MKIETADQAREVYRKAKRLSLERLVEHHATWPDDIPEASGLLAMKAEAKAKSKGGGAFVPRHATIEVLRWPEL